MVKAFPKDLPCVCHYQKHDLYMFDLKVLCCHINFDQNACHRSCKRDPYNPQPVVLALSINAAEDAIAFLEGGSE